MAALDSQLDQLERDAAPLVSQWTGTARDAYDQRASRWRAAAADLSGMLRAIKGAVDESAADYLATERNNAMLFD
jgi:WXG100 family type VII secretion target